MTNVLTNRTWVCDTAGILTNSPTIIRRLVYYPNATADTVVLNSYSAGVPAATGSATVTITSTNIITDDASLAFPNTYRDGDIIKITSIDGGTAGNKGTYLITTAGDNAHIHVDATLSNDTSKLYSWERYAYYFQTGIKAGASDASPATIDFAPEGGLSVPNLILESISASSTLYIYLM